MSTYLQLVTDLRTECGVSGTNTTVVNATGEWGRLCKWIRDAWVEIQEAETQWEWMRKSTSFNTTVNQGEYTAVQAGVTNFGVWKERSFRLYLASAGVGTEQKIGYKDYGIFRDYYLLASRKTTYSRPIEITVSPSKTLILGLAPNDIYTVSGEYYQAPIVLAADTDTPDMPAKFHNAIVHKAKMKYGTFEAAPEVYNAGKDDLAPFMTRIRREQLPQMRRGGPL